MKHPHYIVTWSEGRLPCPPQYRGTVVQKEFDKGRIGGRRNIERRVETPQEALRLLNEDRFNRIVYEVASPRTYRRRLRHDEVARIAKEADDKA